VPLDGPDQETAFDHGLGALNASAAGVHAASGNVSETASPVAPDRETVERDVYPNPNAALIRHRFKKGRARKPRDHSALCAYFAGVPDRTGKTRPGLVEVDSVTNARSLRTLSGVIPSGLPACCAERKSQRRRGASSEHRIESRQGAARSALGREVRTSPKL